MRSRDLRRRSVAWLASLCLAACGTEAIRSEPAIEGAEAAPSVAAPEAAPTEAAPPPDELRNSWRGPVVSPCPRLWTGLVRHEGGPWKVCDEIVGATGLEHRLLIAGHNERTAIEGGSRCTVRVVSTTPASGHPLHPLSPSHFGPLLTDATEEEQPADDGLARVEIERRAGNRQVLWAAMWATDLPPRLAVPGRPTLGPEDIATWFRSADERRPIRRQDYFAPEIGERSTRIAMAETRVRFDPNTRLSAIPLCRDGHLDYRVVALSRSIPGSVEASLWRTIIRSAVLGGARPLIDGGCATP